MTGCMIGSAETAVDLRIVLGAGVELDISVVCGVRFAVVVLESLTLRCRLGGGRIGPESLYAGCCVGFI